jgi:hypothetical protein
MRGNTAAADFSFISSGSSSQITHFTILWPTLKEEHRDIAKFVQSSFIHRYLLSLRKTNEEAKMQQDNEQGNCQTLTTKDPLHRVQLGPPEADRAKDVGSIAKNIFFSTNIYSSKVK